MRINRIFFFFLCIMFVKSMTCRRHCAKKSFVYIGRYSAKALTGMPHGA